MTINVTASTSIPYEKTISCTFTLRAETQGTNTYSIEDVVNRDYALLKLSCPNAEATVTIEIDPTKVRIDSNDEIYKNKTSMTVDSNGLVNKIVFILPAETTRYVKFYKVDKTKDYTYPGFVGTHPIKVTI